MEFSLINQKLDPFLKFVARLLQRNYALIFHLLRSSIQKELANLQIPQKKIKNHTKYSTMNMAEN